MPNPWGRSPRNDFWQDLQALAFWVVIVGLICYIIFPSFFSDVYSRLTDPKTEVVNADSGTYDPNSLTDSYDLGNYGTFGTNNELYFSQDYQIPNAIQSTMYNLGNEISIGYWVLFVAEDNFQQLSITSEAYTFLLRIIEKDKLQEGKNTIILASNGQIKKFVVSNEVYSIITSMAVIDTRSKTS